MKKILLTILAIFSLTVLLCGCALTSEKVSQEQLKTDISKIEKLYDGYVQADLMPKEKYSIEDYSITKRQTNLDEKQELIYCDVTISNSYVNTVVNLKLEYNYYDEGGWILDNSEMQEFKSTPLSGVDPNLVNIGSVSCKVNSVFNSNPSVYSFSSQNTDLENFKNTLKYECKLNNYTAKASCELSWSQQYGWVPASTQQPTQALNISIDEIDINWNELLIGSWTFEGREYDDRLTIDKIDDKLNFQGTYIRLYNHDSMYSPIKKGDLLWEGSIKAPFNTATGIIDTVVALTLNNGKKDTYDLTMSYNITTNTWKSSSISMLGSDDLELNPDKK